MGNLIRLARQALIGLGSFSAAELALEGVTGGFGGAGGGGDSFFGFGGGDGRKRRRRRKALSDTDMKTALTIASAISKKAAENFILMRVRKG